MLLQQTIQIKGKDYLVKFPNVGQLMDIESFKMIITKNKYVSLSMSDLKTHLFILDLADSISYLSVLLPDLKEDLGIKNWLDVDPFLVKDLIKVYRKQFLPWFMPILKDLYSYDDDQDGNEADDKQIKE
jgi:hypothetical protein